MIIGRIWTVVAYTRPPPSLSRDPHDFALALIVDGLSDEKLQTRCVSDCWLTLLVVLLFVGDYSIKNTTLIQPMQSTKYYEKTFLIPQHIFHTFITIPHNAPALKQSSSTDLVNLWTWSWPNISSKLSSPLSSASSTFTAFPESRQAWTEGAITMKCSSGGRGSWHTESAGCVSRVQRCEWHPPLTTSQTFTRWSLLVLRSQWCRNRPFRPPRCFIRPSDCPWRHSKNPNPKQWKPATRINVSWWVLILRWYWTRLLLRPATSDQTLLSWNAPCNLVRLRLFPPPFRIDIHRPQTKHNHTCHSLWPYYRPLSPLSLILTPIQHTHNPGHPLKPSRRRPLFRARVLMMNLMKLCLRDGSSTTSSPPRDCLGNNQALLNM